MMHLPITRLPPLVLIEKAVGSGQAIDARYDRFVWPVESLYHAREPGISGNSIAVSQMAHLFEARRHVEWAIQTKGVGRKTRNLSKKFYDTDTLSGQIRSSLVRYIIDKVL